MGAIMKSGRTTIVLEKLPPIVGPYSYGVKAGGWIFSAGLLGVDSEGALVGKTPGRPDVEAQTRGALQNLTTVLEELGASREKVTKVQGYITDFRYLDRYDKTYCEFFAPPYPARATHGKGLSFSDATIEVDGIATVSGKSREIRSPELAEWEVACAQSGTLVDDVFFTSGHMSRDTRGGLVGRGDLRAQTEQALDNLELALEAADFGFSDVMMINATVPDWFGYQAYNETFLKYFREPLRGPRNDSRDSSIGRHADRVRSSGGKRKDQAIRRIRCGRCGSFRRQAQTGHDLPSGSTPCSRAALSCGASRSAGFFVWSDPVRLIRPARGTG